MPPVGGVHGTAWSASLASHEPGTQKGFLAALDRSRKGGDEAHRAVVADRQVRALATDEGQFLVADQRTDGHDEPTLVGELVHQGAGDAITGAAHVDGGKRGTVGGAGKAIGVADLDPWGTAHEARAHGAHQGGLAFDGHHAAKGSHEVVEQGGDPARPSADVEGRSARADLEQAEHLGHQARLADGLSHCRGQGGVVIAASAFVLSEEEITIDLAQGDLDGPMGTGHRLPHPSRFAHGV